VAFLYLGSTYTLKVEEEMSFETPVTSTSRHVVILQNTESSAASPWAHQSSQISLLEGKADAEGYSFRQGIKKM
jgi:hypothetical protein